jgi:hypothetical protein
MHFRTREIASACVRFGIVAIGLTFDAMGASKPEATTECVVELNLPAYSGIEWQARLAGTAEVKIRVGKYGRAADISVVGIHQVLAVLIRGALEKSIFVSSCEGRTLSYKLTLEIEGPPSQGPVNSVKVRPPNHYIITANPPVQFTNIKLGGRFTIPR